MRIPAELPRAAGEHGTGLTLGYAEGETFAQSPGRLHAGLTQIMPGILGEMVEPVTETATADEGIGPYFGFIEARSSLGQGVWPCGSLDGHRPHLHQRRRC